MSSHDRYLELGALAAIGQISVDEDRELSQHLRECHECRDAYSDYSSILHNHLPNASPVRFRLKKHFVHTAPPNEIRERFLARARSEGAEFSAEVEAHARKSRPRFWGIGFGRFVWAAATAAILILAISSVASFRFAMRMRSRQAADLLQQNRLLANELEQVKQKPPRTILVQQDNEQEQIALQVQIQALTRQLRESAQRARSIEDHLETLQSRNTSLAGQHQQDQTEIRGLQVQLAQEKEASTSTIAALVEAQDKIKTLNGVISEKSQRLAMDQQLNSVGSDVRQLMGARNLHIIDVHDVNASGKSTKSFGRVFYSEGQSLVFYAFDLPASKSAKYVFKAWGQMEANEQSVHDLGVFSLDDHEQRRWVLKVSAPQLLKGIDSVFVTAEAAGDSVTPQGKRVLYAYLAGQANHP